MYVCMYMCLQNQIRVSVQIVSSSNQSIIESWGKSLLSAPVNRIISVYVHKSLLVNMILHSLAGAVESECWQARGQDCRHRKSWRGPFHMSLAGFQGRDRNLLQVFQGGMGLALRQGRASGQRYCIQFSRVCRQKFKRYSSWFLMYNAFLKFTMQRICMYVVKLSFGG
mgnify:CR=1 FL=1